MPRALQAVLVLVRLLFVVTIVGVVNVLALASSVDAVDGRLLGMVLYAALPGFVGLALSLYVRTGGRWIRWGLIAVHVWLVLGAVSALSVGEGGPGVPHLVMPVAVLVLLLRSDARRWFALACDERDLSKPFDIAGLMARARDRGQSALEYLGMVLVVVALVGAMSATGVGTQLTGEIRNAICELTGGGCSSRGGDAVAGGGTEPNAGTVGGSVSGGSVSGGTVGGGSASGGSASGGTADGGTASGGSADGGTTTGSTTTSGTSTTGGSTGTSTTGGSTGTSTTGGSTGTSTTGGSTGTSTTGSTGTTSSTGTTTGAPEDDDTVPQHAQVARPSGGSGGGSRGGFFDGLVGDGLWGDVEGAVKTVLNPVESLTGLGDQWSKDTRGAGAKWTGGDWAGAVGEWVDASGGVGVGDMGLPGSGTRVGAEVRAQERQYLADRIPVNGSAAGRKGWWDGLSQGDRDRYLELLPDRIGNLDGIPADVRDRANRQNLQDLIARLEGRKDKKSQTMLAGLKEIDRQLKQGSQPPMFLLGIGDEGNGRAIVSYGNPDLSRNVSAYVPGLNTSLDEEFAKNDLKRARDTAIGAQGYDSSSASIVWLGYDAPQLPGDGGVAGYFAIMGTARAEKGGAAYNDFWSGLTATSKVKDPHFTAIGHSYGSRTVGAAAQRLGGIPGVDDIILVGSPGVGADHAVDLGVGAGHVFVGSAANDPVTKLPSKTQVAVGSAGLILGPAGAYLAGDLADPGDDDLWFGKDPASKAFGARRFPVDPGPPVISGNGLSGEAHSQYFDPVRDAVSADSIALIVSGNSSHLRIEEQR
ncbi:alpha/beta hydrolase [uncultured Streptomyces sp.]|uniref:alpha/beta hydrolase n=1 Tax=uncultured Streptomyces sp. TaxID=174707 RepID=UPI0026117CD1|nr:alpha/beta hydrolase [uncultured Streptomyces sp.]